MISKPVPLKIQEHWAFLSPNLNNLQNTQNFNHFNKTQVLNVYGFPYSVHSAQDSFLCLHSPDSHSAQNPFMP